MPFLRSRNTVVLAKIETTEGVDASPAGTDAVKVENPKISYNTNIITTNEVSGSLDVSTPIVGGMKAQLTFDYYLKGNGAPGTTAPEWGRLLKACGWTETLQGAALGSPTALTAGTTNSATLAASPFVGADNAYRGLPLLITGTTPAGFGQSMILGYTQSTKIALLTDTAGSALTSGATVLIPPNALYTPGSTSIPSLTFYVYMDSILYKFLGARGTFKLSVASGGPAKLSFTFMGMFSSETDSTNPTATYDSVLKPIWKNTGSGVAGGPAAFTLNTVAAAMKTFNLDCGNQMVNPDDPNALESFDPAQITSRNLTGDIDPYQTAIATRDLITDFRSQNLRPLHLRLGTATGNRVGITIPAALYTGADPGDNSGLNTRSVKFDCTGNDAASVQLCVF